MPSTAVVEEMVPRLLKEVSDIFQLLEDVAVLELEELEELEEVEELELEELEELELEELLLEGHDASSKYHIWLSEYFVVYCKTFAPEEVLLPLTSRQLA